MLRKLAYAIVATAALALAACAGADKAGTPKPARAVSSAKAASLMGKGPEDLRAMLGEPSLLRRDQGAEVWQYAGESCVLFLYLYPDDAGAPAVTYVDARLKTQGPAPVPECLAEALRAQKRGGGRGSGGEGAPTL
jgi:hypothetical protein